MVIQELDHLFKLEKQEKQLDMINDKLYVPVVTLSINDNMKLLENIRPGF